MIDFEFLQEANNFSECIYASQEYMIEESIVKLIN